MSKKLLQNTSVEMNVLVTVCKDGQYFGLHETQHTTSPFKTRDITQAKQIVPFKKEELSKPESPSYYFEPSSRMRFWFREYGVDYMMPVRIKTTTKVTKI